MINSRQTSLFIALSALCVLSVTSLLGCGELGPFGLQLTNKGTVERDRVVEPGDQGGTVSRPGTSGPGNGAQGNGGVKPGTGVQEPTEPENGNGGGKPGTGEHGDGNGGQGDGGVKPGTGGHGPGNGGQGNGGVKPGTGDGQGGNHGTRKTVGVVLRMCFPLEGGELSASYDARQGGNFLLKEGMYYDGTMTQYGCFLIDKESLIISNGDTYEAKNFGNSYVSVIHFKSNKVPVFDIAYEKTGNRGMSSNFSSLTYKRLQKDASCLESAVLSKEVKQFSYCSAGQERYFLYGPPNFQMQVEVP